MHRMGRSHTDHDPIGPASSRVRSTPRDGDGRRQRAAYGPHHRHGGLRQKDGRGRRQRLGVTHRHARRRRRRPVSPGTPNLDRGAWARPCSGRSNPSFKNFQSPAIQIRAMAYKWRVGVPEGRVALGLL